MSPGRNPSPVRVERHEAVVLLTLDRPERRNAVDHATLVALRAAQLEIEADESVRAVVLTGAPPAFCAGADLTGVEGGVFAEALAAVLQGFGALRVPVIAAVDGPALGAGTQLAIACDLRVATPASRFGIPAANLGLAVDAWTIARLGHLVGGSIARDMLLVATAYTAERLAPTGFIHRVGGLDEAMAWASQIAGLAPLTIAAHKLALESLTTTTDAGPAFEAARVAAWASADAEEGRAAFLAKRPARFTGR